MSHNVQSLVLLFCICVSFIDNARAVAIPSRNELLQIQIFSNTNFTGSTITYESSLEICLEVNLNANLTQAADVQNSAKLIRGRCVLLCNSTCNEEADTSEKCLEMKAVNTNTSPAKINATSYVVRSIRRCNRKKMQNNKPQIEFY